MDEIKTRDFQGCAIKEYQIMILVLPLFKYGYVMSLYEKECKQMHAKMSFHIFDVESLKKETQ